MSIYDPKPGDTIPNWSEAVGPYKCTESAPAVTQNGDNPSFSESADLPQQGDIRNYSGPGAKGADPTPAKPGA